MAEPLPWLQWGGDSILGQGLGGLFGAAGGMMGMGALNDARSDIKSMPGMKGPINLWTSLGSAVGSNAQFNPLFQGNQMALGQVAPGLLGGGLFNDPSLRQALGHNDISGALQQANQAFGQQVGPQALGSLQGMFGQANELGNMFAQQAMGGPQDLTGGLQSGLFGQGFANQQAAGNFSGLMNSRLASMRAAAQPEQNRMFNSLQDRLFAQGRLGSTGGSENMRALFDSFAQQDLGFQNAAFGQAMQRGNFLSNLGSQQIAQGSGLLGQNLGQFNQNAAHAQNFMGLGAGLEGQAFNQNLQSVGANQAAGLGRLQAAQGLLGFGGDLFASQFGLGLGAQEGLLGFGDLGLQLAKSPFELQAGLLSGSSGHASALGNLGSDRATGIGSFLGGLGSAAMTLFSDARLKDNIVPVGQRGDITIYRWDWNEQAEEIGAASQPNIGVLAQDIEVIYPEAVTESDGYKKVDYGYVFTRVKTGGDQ